MFDFSFNVLEFIVNAIEGLVVGTGDNVLGHILVIFLHFLFLNFRVATAFIKEVIERLAGILECFSLHASLGEIRNALPRFDHNVVTFHDSLENVANLCGVGEDRAVHAVFEGRGGLTVDELYVVWNEAVVVICNICLLLNLLFDLTRWHLTGS